jgi:hypothetical protein
MRIQLTVFAGLVAGAFAEPASSDPYKWCAVLGGSGSTRCYFHTVEQCRASISGGTSFCSENHFYDGKSNDSAPAPQVRRRR